MASFEQAFRILASRTQERDHEHEEGRKMVADSIPAGVAHSTSQHTPVQVITTGICPSIDVSTLTPLQLMHRFQKLQSERVAIYSEFEEYDIFIGWLIC